MWWFWGAWIAIFLFWETAHLTMNSLAARAGGGVMRGATKTSRAAGAGEKASSLPDFEHWEEARQEEREHCKHFNCVSVDNDILGRVAWLCTDCDQQLPATFLPPQLRGEEPPFDPGNPQSEGWTIQRARNDKGFITYRDREVRDAFLADAHRMSW